LKSADAINSIKLNIFGAKNMENNFTTAVLAGIGTFWLVIFFADSLSIRVPTISI
jgi:hypothetical protein